MYDFIGLDDFNMFMNENILIRKLRIIAGITNVEKAEFIAKRFLKEWVDVVLSCGEYVNSTFIKSGVKSESLSQNLYEKILVTNDLDTERILIHGFCYTGKERGWYGRKVKESLVHEVDKYGDLIFAELVFHPQKSITDFSNSGVNSNLEVNSKNYSAFFEV